MKKKILKIQELEKRVLLDASLGALASTTVFGEQDVNAGAVVLDSDVTVTGSTTDFTGESLTVSTDGGADDQLTINNEGTAAGQIGISGNDVTYGGTIIGTISSDGVNGADLIIDLNGNASKAAIERLIENITYANASDNPVTSRTLNYALGGYFFQNMDVIIVPFNEGPSVDTNTGLTLDEGDTQVITSAHLGITDVDNLDTEVTITITQAVTKGRVELSTNAGVAITSFTLDDLNSGLVRYVHNDSNTTSDLFKFTVTDGNITTSQANFNITVTPVDDAPVIVTNTGTDVYKGFEVGIGGVEMPAKFGNEVARLSGVGQHGNLQGIVDNNNTQFAIVFTTPAVTPSAVPGQVIFESGGSGKGIGLYLNSAGKLAWHSGTSQASPLLTSAISLSNSTQYAVVIEIDQNTDEIRMHYTEAADFNWFEFGRSAEATLTGYTQTDHDGGNGAGVGEVGSGSYGGFNGTVTGVTTFQGTIDSDLVLTRFPSGGATTIVNEKLVVTDNDTAASSIVYTITTDAQDGEIYKSGVLLGVGDTFTQADLNAGTVTYLHSGINDPSDSFIFSVSDGTTTIANQTYSIAVETTNSAPVLDVQPLAIAEDAANSTSAGTIVATDSDPGQTLTYSITGGTGAGIFAIDASSGQVTLVDNSTLDYETITSYTLIVRVTDDAGSPLFDEETFTINVQDVYEGTAPAFTAWGPFNVDENTANNTLVGTVAATDADGDSITYSIVAGNTGSAFKINAGNGNISINDINQINFELRSSYTLTIRATDNSVDNLFTNRTVTISINDLNEVPTIDPQQVIELQNAGVYYSAATGNFYKYVNTNTTYNAANNAANAALLNGVNGHLVTITSAAENTFVRGIMGNHIWLGASDAAQEGKWLWITGPEAGSQFSQGGNAVNGFYENWNGTEPNSGASANNAYLNTNGTWYDQNGGNRYYVIEWEGADVINNTAYTISHSNADASDIPLNYSVATLQSYDDDGDTLEFTIQAGNDDGVFAIDINTGEITIADKSNLDASLNDIYTLTIRVQEQGGGAFSERDIIITFDQAFSITQNNGTTVDENSNIIITNANLQVSDSDTAAADLHYSITGTPANGHLELTTFPGAIITSFTQADIDAGILRYVHDGSETISDSFTFSVSDGAEILAGQVFNITVDPVNQGPTVATNTGTTIAEGASKVITSAMLSGADDDDNAAGITYTASNYISGHITVNGVVQNTFTQADINAGLVRFVHDGSDANGRFDFSLADGGEDGATASTGTFTLTYTNVNDAPTITTNASPNVLEGGQVTITTAHLNTTDPDDSGIGLTYTLSNIQNGLVVLSTAPAIPVLSFTQADLVAGKVIFKHDGGEGQGRFDVTVADGGENGAGTDTVNFVVNRTPVNDAPTIAVNAGSSVNQNSIVVLKQSVLRAADPDDSGAGLTYTVTGATNGQLEFLSNPNVAITSFTQDDINNSRVVFRHSGPPGAANFNFTLADGGEDGAGTVNGTFNFTVDNTNDAPTITTNSSPTFDEGSTNVITTAMLDSFDPDDFGTGLTWTVSALTNGIIQVNGVTQNTFTQADLDAGLVTFIHDGSETITAGFNVSLADGGEDGAGAAAAAFSINITPINEGPTLVANDGNPNLIDFHDYTFGSFDASQDVGGTVTISPDGSMLTMTGNMWKKIDLPYTVTANTVLTFEFQTDTNGEIFGIGFDDNSNFANGVYGYQLAGTQIWTGNIDQTFRNYQIGDGWVRFDIPIGQDYTGVMNKMVFILDNDSGPAPTINFRNVGFYESDQVVEMNEGGNLTITNAMINGIDPDDSGTGLIYTISNLEYGHIEVNGVAQNTFTQDDIDNARVVFVHDGSEGTYAGFDISLADGGENGTTADTDSFRIVVNQVDDLPVAGANTGMTVNEGSTTTITTAMLNASDVDTADSQVRFTITDAPDNGRIVFSSAPGTTITSFTLADLQANRVIYVHNGSETIIDSFDFTIRDATTTLAADTFNITVTPVNENVVVATNTGANITESGTVTITSARLNTTDVDDTATGITYTVTSTQNGWVELTTKVGFPVTSFTQDDINNNRVVFRHDGSGANAANFTFSVVDGGENGTTAVTGTFAVNVNTAVNHGPTVAVSDGTPTTIDFSGTAISAYDASGAGDGQGSTFTSYKVSSDGTVLTIYGNSWKRIALPMTLTADTVITFDFRSTKEGEIHGIGFDNDNAISNGSFSYELFGTDPNGLFDQSYNTYNLGDGWVRYEIPIGADFTGAVTHMFFMADDDAGSDAISQFRNVSIYEKNPTLTMNEGGSFAITNTNLNAFDTDDAAAGLTYTASNLSNGHIEVNGVTQNTFTQADVNNGLVYFVHDDSETITAGFDISLADGGENGAGADTASISITVTPVNEGPTITGDRAATLDEGASYTLTAADLGASDPDDAAADVTFTASSVTNGTITVNGVAQNTFTYADIQNGLVVFTHDGGETIAAGFNISLADGGEDGAVAATSSFSFTVNPVNDDAAIATNTGAAMDEGANLTITNAMLAGSDPDDAAADLAYTASNLVNGHIEVNGVTQNTFTQADINNGLVVFVHDGSDTIAASFDFQLTDNDPGGAASVGATFNITVNPVNDIPVAVTNTGTTLDEGGSVDLDNTMLAATDSESADAGLIYTITTLPDGVLMNTNTLTVLGTGDTFTQSDLDNGFIRYTHDGSEQTSSILWFTIGDGTDTTAVQSFTFNINPVNDAPTEITMTGGTVEENSAEGTVVGTLETLDADLPGDTITYRIMNDASGLFAISGNSIIVRGAINYEAMQSMNLMIEADDGQGGTFQQSFTINITDVVERSLSDDFFIAPREEAFDRYVENFRNISGDGYAFFGEGHLEDREINYGQVVREYTTLYLAGKIEEGRNLILLGSYVPASSFFVPEGNGDVPPHSDRGAQYTTLAQALAFMQTIDQGDTIREVLESMEADEQVGAENELSASERQFRDVLSYYQEKQAKLRQALTG
ncbi:MAG: cadherin domain-containing protein [Alphaproteobacteria bacterium]|nr:cadherin domain-containing protein [Alphaproteobacteria bacterium]